MGQRESLNILLSICSRIRQVTLLNFVCLDFMDCGSFVKLYVVGVPRPAEEEDVSLIIEYSEK